MNTSVHTFEHSTEMVVNGVRMIGRRRDDTLVISMGHDMSPASTVEAEIDLETAWEMVKELMELIEVGYVEEFEEVEEIGDGLSDAEADADTLASAGWGTDEDYGG